MISLRAAGSSLGGDCSWVREAFHIRFKLRCDPQPRPCRAALTSAHPWSETTPWEQSRGPCKHKYDPTICVPPVVSMSSRALFSNHRQLGDKRHWTLGSDGSWWCRTQPQRGWGTSAPSRGAHSFLSHTLWLCYLYPAFCVTTGGCCGGQHAYRQGSSKSALIFRQGQRLQLENGRKERFNFPITLISQGHHKLG